MPQPTKNDVYVDEALNDVSVAFMQEDDNFAFNQVFPEVPVNQPSGDFFVWDKDMMRRTEAEKRAPGSEAAERGQELNTQKYSTDVWGLKQPIDDQTRRAQAQAVNLEEGVTEGLMFDIMLRFENEFSSNYMTTGTWSTEQDGSGSDFDQWDTTGSTPIDDIREQAREMQRKTGFRPNILVLGAETYDALVQNEQIVDRLQYTDSAPVTQDFLANHFEVDEIVVSQASENTADEGATASNSFVVGDSALLAYSAPSPALMTPSAGYRFVWSDMSQGQNGITTYNYRDAPKHSDFIEIETAFDMNVVAQDLGVLFYNTTS